MGIPTPQATPAAQSPAPLELLRTGDRAAALRAGNEARRCGGSVSGGPVGNGGVGKTTLAIAYAWKHETDYPGGLTSSSADIQGISRRNSTGWPMRSASSCRKRPTSRPGRSRSGSMPASAPADLRQRRRRCPVAGDLRGALPAGRDLPAARHHASIDPAGRDAKAARSALRERWPRTPGDVPADQAGREEGRHRHHQLVQWPGSA